MRRNRLKKFLRRNRDLIAAILISVVFHALLIVVLDFTRKEEPTPPDTSADEMLIQLEEIERILEEVTPPAPAQKQQEEAVSTASSTLQTEASDEAVRVADKLPEPAKLDSVASEKTVTALQKMAEAPPMPMIPDSILADLRSGINKTDSTRRSKAQKAIDYDFIRKNYRTIYNLKKVYVYAKRAKTIIEEINKQLGGAQSDKEKKELIKKMEKELFTMFEKEVTNLSITQGRLLIKLIYRETGKSTYDIIKEYKGALPAAFWQGVARLFKHNLKSEYDSTGEDALLEKIILKYEKKEL